MLRESKGDRRLKKSVNVLTRDYIEKAVVREKECVGKPKPVFERQNSCGIFKRVSGDTSMMKCLEGTNKMQENGLK